MADELVGIIGGSGLGDALIEHITDTKIKDVTTPFGKPSWPITIGSLGSKRIAFLNRHSEGHTLSPSDVPYAANIFALKKVGVTSVIATGAVGSLKEEIAPENLVLVDQFIDKTFRRQSSFFSQMGAVHCEFDQPCCGRLRKDILKSAEKTKAVTHETGTYVCMEGPQFSTRAESLMHQSWGADIIGMTAMPEAKLCREAQMCYSLICLVSDYDCWKPHPKGKDKHDLLAEIIGNLTEATSNAIELIKAVLDSDSELCSDDCSCRKSLDMAVWTPPDYVDEKRKKRLKVLFD